MDSSPTIPLPPLAAWKLDAYIIAACWNARGTSAAFAAADGQILLTDRAKPPTVRRVDSGALQVLALCALGADAFALTTDTGSVTGLYPSGETRELARFPGQWIDRIAAGADGRLAVAVGRHVVALEADGRELSRFGPHESTVAGVGFSADGSRVIASHYGGASIWKVEEPASPPRRLRFAGSHLEITMSPNARFLATSTQEKELHVWRLKENRDMRMSGYYAKAHFLSWSADLAWLVTSGGDAAIAWPFAGKGPEGQGPRMVGPISESLVSCVACHPSAPIVAIGYGSGAVVLSSLTETPLDVLIDEGSGEPVTALNWSPDGNLLASGTRDGKAGLAYVGES